MQAMLVLVERILHNIIRSKKHFFSFLLFALSYQNKTTTWVLQVKETFFAFLLFVLSYQNNSVEDDATKYLLCFLALCTELLQMAGICRIQTTPSGGFCTGFRFTEDAHMNLFGLLQDYSWQLVTILCSSLFVNRISGEIPKELGSITTLTYLILSSNKLSGKLRVTFAKFQNLTDLRIGDINGPSQDFPMLRNMTGMAILDASFNKLVGEIPVAAHVGHLRFLFLTGNMLSGNVPEPVLMDGSSVNLNLNLFRSFSGTKLQGILPCSKISNCPAYSHCFHVNCGGKNVKVMENDENIHYVGDGDLPELYKTAHVTPISLTYFHYCLENGKYTVKLHFAEIQFSNDNTFGSLGKRLFDIYVQNILEIQFYWAGKGTTRIPVGGVYGPLISAFSIVSDSKPCSDQKNARHKIIVGVGFGVTALCLVFIIV
ncbi:hypothetical protein JHK87_021045 [Glycine soja]|nr:hypothetical protein JHK87_021045 [Glycine soja]